MAAEYDIARLRDEASQALKTLRLDQALKSYLELERVDPDNDWARRAAAVHMMLGRSADAVEALLRAERFYSGHGDVLKAAAVCKHILQIDPKNREALTRVQSLKSEWDKARGSPAASPSKAGETQARTQSIISKLPHDAGLSNVPLREVVPGAARASGRASGSDGIYRIPLQDEDQMVASVEREVRDAERVNASLSASPLFAELDEKIFARLVMHARLVEVSANDVLFRQGDPGDALYVIAEGRIGVIDEGPPRRGVAQLGDGDFFGEIALLADQPRNATITALEDTKLIAIGRDLVLELVSAEPRFLDALLRFLRDRLAGKLMSTNPLFTTLSARDQNALRSRFRFLEVDKGAVLLQQGQKPDGVLLLLTGTAEAVHPHQGRDVLVGDLEPGDIFGETELLANGPSHGTVRAKKKCLVLELPAEAFLKILHARPDAMAFVKQVIELRTARTNAILSGLAPPVFPGSRVRF